MWKAEFMTNGVETMFDEINCPYCGNAWDVAEDWDSGYPRDLSEIETWCYVCGKNFVYSAVPCYSISIEKEEDRLLKEEKNVERIKELLKKSGWNDKEIGEVSKELLNRIKERVLENDKA